MKLLLAMFMSLFASVSALANISFENARIRLMPPGAGATAAFVVIKNGSDKPVEILGAKADFAKTVELHTHKVEDGVMRMRQVDKMVVPAKGQLELKPHGDHLMFFGLNKDLKAGEKQKLTFKLSSGKSAKADFEVQDMNKGHH